jgi:hypothetical protein
LTSPYLDKLVIKIETHHRPGNGEVANVHGLTGKPLEKRVVELIDIAAPVDPAKYKEEEDPAKFKSARTGRGPLAPSPGWQGTVSPVMCAYKLVTVEFPYFGLQGKVENLIQSYQRSLFNASHRQLFCWIDEWFGKTMEDIRTMERETKALLDAKIADASQQVQNDLVPVE